MKKLVLLCIFISVLFFTANSFAQGVTSSGTDFWLGFMPNGQPGAGNFQRLELFIASATNSQVTVTIQGSSRKISVGAGSVLDFVIDQNAITVQADTPTDNAIHVTSTNPVTIYGYSVWTCSACSGGSPDGYLALPITSYGTKYYTMNFPDGTTFSSAGANGLRKGEFLVIAPYDNTQVTITPKGETSTGRHAATPYIVTLQQGQTYLVQSAGTTSGDNDLTGSLITSSRPVAVVTGHEISAVPSGGSSADHLIEMIPPVDKWGTTYYDMPMTGRLQCGDFLRVLSAENNNTITVNGQVATFLSAGDYHDFEFSTDPKVISSQDHKKIIVGLYSYSQGTSGDPAQADPFLILLPPQEQFASELVFRAPTPSKSNSFNNYVTFIAPSDSIKKIAINGTGSSGYQQVGLTAFPNTNPPMSAMRIKLPMNSNGITFTAKGPVSFGAYQYGFSNYEGYGWPVGVSQRIVGPDTLAPLAHVDNSSCLTKQITIYEPRTKGSGSSFDDTRLAYVAAITDTADLRWPTPSYNYHVSIDTNFVTGDSVAHVTITVLDGKKDAYAAIFATDRAGNDTVFEYHYYAPALDLTPLSANFGPVLVDKDSCISVQLHNNGLVDLAIDSISLIGDDHGLLTLNAPKNVVIHPDSLRTIQLCFQPTDTVLRLTDSVLLFTSCVPYYLSISGRGVTPLIDVEDVDFGNVAVGDTLCKELTISNVGKARLTILKTDFQGDSNFSFFNLLDSLEFPPGGSIVLDACFHPQSSGTFSKRVTFFNNNPAPYQHSIKDTSQFFGTSISSAVKEDASALSIDRAFPNPFENSVMLRYSLSRTASVTVRVFDVTGREVRSVASSELQSIGSHDVKLDLSALPSGVYLCSTRSMDASGSQLSEPIFLTKE